MVMEEVVVQMAQMSNVTMVKNTVQRIAVYRIKWMKIKI